ncbi:MAG: amidohydrolase family protein [Rhodobacteraceae bacterium]|nr:amidohydrolase family protein [Paracoccaceae bacterium]
MGARRGDGQGEAIIDPDLPIVDAHHHLYDFPHYRYLLDDYLADCGSGHRFVASVYAEIQAFPRPNGPEALRHLGEVEFANGIGAMCASGQYGPRVAAAIIGHADLRRGRAVGEFLDRAMEIAPDRFRGIRQIAIEHPDEEIYRYITHRPPKGVLRDPGFRDGFAELARRGLVFDAAVFHNQLPEIRALALAFPDAPIVLNHLGIAVGIQSGPAAVFDDWRQGLRDLAQCRNVLCKIGGFGLPFWGFGFDQRSEGAGSAELAAVWRPYVEVALEAFGPDRCMMESNYPVDSRSAGFVPVWNALKLCMAGWSEAEKRAAFCTTATRVYGVDLPPEGGL